MQDAHDRSKPASGARRSWRMNCVEERSGANGILTADQGRG
jgi:hypothetical protein